MRAPRARAAAAGGRARGGSERGRLSTVYYTVDTTITRDATAWRGRGRAPAIAHARTPTAGRLQLLYRAVTSRVVVLMFVLMFMLFPHRIAAAAAAVAAPAAAVAVYPASFDPFTNPLRRMSWVQPPRAWANSTCHFSAWRGGLGADALDKYNASGLGDVIWPQWPVLIANESTLRTQLQGLKARGLWLTDISNYVPGDPSDCNPSDARGISGVCEYHTPRRVQDLLNETLGERFTGMDNGEQDGRYISYAGGQYRGRGGGAAAAPSELRQSFLHFGKFFDRMADDLGNKLMALNSLWDTHYFARSGFYTALGETC